MLFALSFDKLVFGHVPDVMSIAGSTLILGSAIVVATMGDSGKNTARKEQPESDIEAQQGLMSGMQTGARGDIETGEDHDRLPVQEVQLRTLR
jgi:hypothetical protein